jgi:hypothetical protein
MSWLRRPKQDDDPDNPNPDNRAEGVDTDTAARRRSRLDRRITNLEHDIERAASAGRAGSHWRRRIEEINAAISQAQEDVKLLDTEPSPNSGVRLAPTPILAIDVSTDIPATVRFSIGGEHFRYSEEVDWTERGEQRSLPGLRRFEGEPAALIPDETPPDRREALQEHLLHAVGALAIALRDGSATLTDDMTLANLASPCPICGNWRDHRDRCITCQRREWQANEIRAEIGRMIEERNGLLEEIANQRDALPILQRQLQDARKELEKYSSG